MAQDATNIHVGPMRIWGGVTAPATGTPPTLITHTSGVFGTGTEVGFTEGDAVFSIVATKTEIFAEQSLGIVGIYTVKEEAVLTFTMQESNYTAWTLATDNFGTVSDGSKKLWYGGGGTGILAPTTQCIAFSSIQRNAPTKFFIGVIYSAYSVKGFKSKFSKKNIALVDVEVRGIEVLTRNANDMMFQFFKEL